MHVVYLVAFAVFILMETRKKDGKNFFANKIC